MVKGHEDIKSEARRENFPPHALVLFTQMVEERGDQEMSKKKRRNVVVLVFAFRLIDYRATVRVSAPHKSSDEDILDVFQGDIPPPFLTWEQRSDDRLTLSDQAPRIIGDFGDDEPDILLTRGQYGLEIAE